MSRLLLISFTALLLGACATSGGNSGRIERGNLVIENVPEIPAALATRLNQYQQTRGAGFEGWLGAEMLITTRFGETAQVHRVAAPLAMREQLTFYPEPVAGALPRPDGKGFVFSKDVGGNEFFQLHYYDLGSGETRLLTDGRSRNAPGPWSNRGDRYAFSTTRRNGTDTDLHIGTPDGAASKPVLEREGSWSALDWSPDDKKLLVMKYISITHSELHVLDVASGTLTRFHETAEPVAFGTARFSRDGKGVYFISDEGSEFRQLRYEDLNGRNARVLSGKIAWDVDEFALSSGGAYLAFTVNAGGVSELHLVDLRSQRALKAPQLPLGIVDGLAFDKAGRQLAFALNGPRSASDVYSLRVGQNSLTRWTRSETGGLKAETFTEPKLIEFSSFDGLKVPAFVYAPSTPGPHPVLINIHGGPEAQSQPFFNPITEFWVRELGIAVIYPNVRGSAGYGKRYLGLDNGFKREDSVKDIGALLNWVATQPNLDKSRVAVIGGSYGGYMTLASMTHYNDRLRAGIDIVGISNFVTFLTNTQDYRRDLRRVEYGDERDPAMREFLERISPTNNASKITRPMFIVQGANDPRVPASEAEQMVETIREQGGEVWYLLAKDEGHGFRKKANRDYYNNAVVLFLQKHLLSN